MIQVILAVLCMWVSSPAMAGEAPEPETAQIVSATPQTQSYRRPAIGFRVGTGLGLTLGGLGLASYGVATLAAANGSGIGVGLSYLGGAALLTTGALVVNLSTLAQAHNVGARPSLAKAGLLLLAGGVALTLVPVSVTRLVAPAVLLLSLVEGALQGHRNVRHARALRVGVMPQVYRGGGYGLGLVAQF